MASQITRYARIRAYLVKPWGAPYGKPNAKVAFHHGRDIIKPANTPIPSPVVGWVVALYTSKYLGYCMVIRVGRGNYVGIAHSKSRRPIGYRVRLGTWIARVAGPRDFHGSEWTGCHTHWVWGTSRRSVLGILTKNPDLVLERALQIAEGRIQ